MIASWSGNSCSRPTCGRYHGLLDLPGQRQDRRVHGKGRRQRRRGVRKTRPRNDDVGDGSPVAWHSPMPCRRRPLVAGVDRPDGVGAIVESVEERIVLHAGSRRSCRCRSLQHRDDGLAVVRDFMASVSVVISSPRLALRLAWGGVRAADGGGTSHATRAGGGKNVNLRAAPDA